MSVRRLLALALVVVAMLTAAALTFAADQPGTATPVPPAAPTAQATSLVVPDVRHQVYVFAEGILLDAGFAWRVEGAVHGFAANVVATQTPAPGTQVVDTGAPTVTLTLSRNGAYPERGTAEERSPFAGTAVQLVGLAAAQRPLPPLPVTHKHAKTSTSAATATAERPLRRATAARHAYAQSRPPAFAVAGAPKEPLDEMPLVDRARLLGRWLDSHPLPTDGNVKHWLYQHAWVVQGAEFGWWRGAEALRLLIRDDRRAEARWGIGSKSEHVAQAALAAVLAKQG